MSRPTKAVVEYFSHKCRHGRVLFVMESLWNNDGYAFFYKIYELLGDAENHVFDLNKAGNRDYLIAHARLNGDIVDIMLAKLAELGIIDGELLKSGLIWSQCFVDDLEDVYSRRKVSKPAKPVQRDKCQHKPDSTGLNEDNCNINPQSKVNESKVKKSSTLPDGKPPQDFLASLKSNPAYQHIDLDIELAKMDAWLLLPKNKKRKKTPSFILNWLNKIEAPINGNVTGPVLGLTPEDEERIAEIERQEAERD